MERLLAFLESSIGKKVVMAVTGLVLFGFVIAHMLGNLQVYAGPTKLDEYGAALRKVPALLWTARLTLLGSALAHLWAAWTLTQRNWAARPVGYRDVQPSASTYASRTMRWSGVILLLFIAYHLLHLTTGTLHPQFVEGAVHNNFVIGFRQPLASGFYILAMICLGFHMHHGIWSLLQTLGLSHPQYDKARLAVATVITAIVVVGNISFPIAVLTGFVREAPRQALSAPAHEGGR